jgi:serine/threonine protein kinase
MKVINKNDVLAAGDAGAGGTLAKSHESENAILAGFTVQSPFTPVLLATFQSERCCYSVLKTPIVSDLRSLIAGQKLSEDVTKFYIGCIALALEFVHKEGFMVRLVEPNSIMVAGNGYPILSDFRLAKRMDGNRSFTICGELLYMAPEMVTGEVRGGGAGVAGRT